MRTDTSTPETHISTRPRRRRSWLLIIPALAMLGVAGGAYTTAHAQTADAADAGGPGGGFAAHRLQHLLDKVNATPSQRGQIQAIWTGLRPQLKSLHQQHAAIRKQMGDALAAATINASQIEQLRQQSMSLADKTSSAFTQGLVQTAQVLTPDQRKQAQAFIQEARSHFHHHMGAMQQPE
jgi:periplasmic protein CpxP/Spy